MLLDNKEYENVLVEQSVVRIAAPLLVDDTPTVRNVTSGTLRNFSALGLDACEYLVGQDIMTPLIEFFRKVTYFFDKYFSRCRNNALVLV